MYKQKSNINNLNIEIGKVSFTEKVIFAKHMSVMIKAGLTISESILILIESSKGKMKKILIDIYNQIETGHSLSDSLNNHKNIFPAILISSVYAGEKSGTLSENLDNVSKQLKKEKDLKDKIRGAMIYPFLVLFATFVLGVSLAVFVLPKIVPLFKGLKTDLPLTTQILIKFSDIVTNNSFELLIYSSIFFVLIFIFISSNFSKPIIDAIIFRLPIIRKIVTNSNLSNICRTFGTLLESGLPIVESIEVTENTVKNYYYKKSLNLISKKIQKGTKLSSELIKFPNLYSPIMIKMIAIGEESGKLEETLEYLSEFYEGEVDNDTKALSTAIEPILLLTIGLFVGFLALSIITPIYDITSNIKK